jgi:hypothetical protein
MKKILLLLIVLVSINSLSFAQKRDIARGAESGELYMTGIWYGLYHPELGPPFFVDMRLAVYRFTENGKKVTIQYDNNDFIYNMCETMCPEYILADATPGVLYNEQLCYDLQLWVSFDYGKNWIFREEKGNYYAVNLEGIIYRYGYDGRYKSTDYGQNFYLTDEIVSKEPGLQEGEAFSVGTNGSYQGRLLHTYNFYKTYTEITIDSQYVYTDPDVYRGGLPGEVYVRSEFPGKYYKVSFSADTGHTFRQVYISERYNTEELAPKFMSDREPGVFYIIKTYYVEFLNPWGEYKKLCVEYYRDYGEILEAVFCHDLTIDYEYKEVICEHTTSLNSKVVSPNSVQLQWSNSAEHIRGYHVYRNNVRITNYELREPSYLDENLPAGNYEYYVRTYYEEGCMSDSSNHVKETITLGIKDITDSEDIILYPNPTTGELHVTCHSSLVTNIEVFDVYGRRLLEQKAEGRRQKAENSPPFMEGWQPQAVGVINISHLHAGIYFVRITTEKGVVMRKVVKL